MGESTRLPVGIEAAHFPLLSSEGFTETSSRTPKYNCIAWAAGDDKRWWWPSFGYYWPLGVSRTNSIEAFIKAFETIGYVECDENERYKPIFENDFDRVALYSLRGVPTHAARQIDQKSWTSKIGKNVDVSHTLRGLEGPLYGSVKTLLKRKK